MSNWSPSHLYLFIARQQDPTTLTPEQKAQLMLYPPPADIPQHVASYLTMEQAKHQLLTERRRTKQTMTHLEIQLTVQMEKQWVGSLKTPFGEYTLRSQTNKTDKKRSHTVINCKTHLYPALQSCAHSLQASLDNSDKLMSAAAEYVTEQHKENNSSQCVLYRYHSRKRKDSKPQDVNIAHNETEQTWLQQSNEFVQAHPQLNGSALGDQLPTLMVLRGRHERINSEVKEISRALASFQESQRVAGNRCRQQALPLGRRVSGG